MSQSLCEENYLQYVHIYIYIHIINHNYTSTDYAYIVFFIILYNIIIYCHMISGSKHSWKRINKELRAPGLRPKSNGAMRHCHQSGGVEPDLLWKMDENGATPMAGWFSSWEIPSMDVENGGTPMTLETSIEFHLLRWFPYHKWWCSTAIAAMWPEGSCFIHAFGGLG